MGCCWPDRNLRRNNWLVCCCFSPHNEPDRAPSQHCRQGRRCSAEKRQRADKSERAWIMVDLEWSPGLSGPQQTTNDSFEPFTSVPFRLRCCNDGKTPGWILEKRACAQIVDRIPTEPDLSRLHTIRFGAEPVRVGK